jgi:Uma2 family endonuclease
LLVIFAEERDLDLNGFGSWTIKQKREERGVEPDECYVLGPMGRKKRPDIAIEVIWTHGGIDELEVYRGLGVPEVWLWKDGRLTLHSLRRDVYEPIARSEIIPGLDLDLLLGHIDLDHQTRAGKRYRAALRGESKRLP